MRLNSWFKLAAVSLAGMIVSFLILWGLQQYNQYQYYNNMNGMQMNGYSNMQGNSGYMPGVNMQGGWNMQGNSGYMPGVNMQGGWNMQGNSGYMPNMNTQGGWNMQGGTGW